MSYDKKNKLSEKSSITEPLKKAELVLERKMTGAEKMDLERSFNCKVVILHNCTVIEGEIDQIKMLPVDKDSFYYRRAITAESVEETTSSGGNAVIYTDLTGKPLKDSTETFTGNVIAKVPLRETIIRIEAGSYGERAAALTIWQETTDETTFEIKRKAILILDPTNVRKIDRLIPASMKNYTEAVKAAITKSYCCPWWNHAFLYSGLDN